MNKKYRYNFSVVRHKKNLQRSLNRFAQLHDVVTIYQMESDAWVFHFYNYDELKKITTYNKKIESLEKEVFNRFEYEINITNPQKIIKAIKGMFEYPNYQSSLIKIIKLYNEEKVIDGHTIVHNNFFLLNQEDIIYELRHQLEKNLKTELSKRFVKQLYTSLHNRIKFPNMYKNSYEESLESPYYKMRKSKKDTSYSNHFETTIKACYSYYKEYGWLLERLDRFDYYLDKSLDGDVFAENDEHVNSWRDNYKFLQSKNILSTLFQSMDFLATNIEIFSDDEMQAVSLTAKDGRIYERTVEKYLNDNKLKVPYNFKDMTKIYRALYNNIDFGTQYAIEMAYLSYLSHR